MAKQPQTDRVIPHLGDVFALAQTVAPSLSTAEQLTESIYAGSTRLDRFALLGELLRQAGLAWQAPEHGGPEAGVEPGVDTDAEAEAEAGPTTDAEASVEARVEADAEADAEAGAESGTKTDAEASVEPAIEPSAESAPASAPPARLSLLDLRVRRHERSRALLSAWSRLEIGDQVLTLLASRGLNNPGDLANVLATTPAHARELQTGASERLSQAVERLVSTGAENGGAANPGDLEALSPRLGSLLEEPGLEFSRRIKDRAAMRGLPAAAGSRSSLRTRFLPVMAVMVIAVSLGLIIPRLLGQNTTEPEIRRSTDLLEAAWISVTESRPLLVTDSPAEAESWFAERLDWRFRVPQVDGLELRGAGFTAMVGGVQVPTLFYGEESTRGEVRVAVVNYALLDRESDHLTIDRATSDGLAAQTLPEVTMRDGRSAIMVRDRDDIYVVIADLVDISLGGRLSFR